MFEEYITIDPKVRGGKPVIKGTRVPVELIVSSLAGGADSDELIAAYEISREQIQACLGFAAQILVQEQFVALSA